MCSNVHKHESYRKINILGEVSLEKGVLYTFYGLREKFYEICPEYKRENHMKKSTVFRMEINFYVFQNSHLKSLTFKRCLIFYINDKF